MSMPYGMKSYTAELANNQCHDRTTVENIRLLNIFPQKYSQFIDNYVLGPLSVFTGMGITTVLSVGYMSLVPSIIYSKYVRKWPSIFNLPSSSNSNTQEDDIKTNTSNTEVGITAIKCIFARSQMYLQQCGGTDNIAPLLMNQLSLFGPNIPGSAFFTQLYARLSRYNYYLTGRIWADQLAEVFMSKLIKFGEVGILQPRTCWLDDVVDSFAIHNKDESFNVVILGAGYDTRFYRLQSIMHKECVKLYEVDGSGSQLNKRTVLNKAKVDSSHVRFISCDFETDDWMDALRSKSDFDKSLPSLFVWEGVTMYLDRENVIETVVKIRMCGKGSCIAFDYFDESCMNSTVMKRTKKIGEPFKFGMDNVEAFVKECNAQTLSNGASDVLQLEIKDHLRCGELKRRYLARYNERYIGYLAEDFGGFLLLGSSPTYKAKLVVVPRKPDIGDVLAGFIVQTSKLAIQSRGVFTIAMSGGSLPSFLQSLPQSFQRAGVNPHWEKWHVLLADERCVVSTDADSNLGSIQSNFTNHVPIPTSQVYGIDETMLSESTDTVATVYEKKVVKPLIEMCDGMLDCVLLGFGPDGHTCSLFPGHPLLNEQTRFVAPIDDSPKPPSSRITLTFPILNKLSRKVVFCGAGSSKQPILRDVFGHSRDPIRLIDGAVAFNAEMIDPPPYPCAMVRPEQQGGDSLVWVVDADAYS